MAPLFQQPFMSGGFPSMNRAVPFTFTMDYSSSSGWTLASGMSISGGTLNYVVPNDPARTSYYDISNTMSDTLWYMDWDYYETSDTATDNYGWSVIGLVAGTSEPVTGSIDCMLGYVVENWSQYRLLLSSKDGGSATNSGQSSDLTQGTQYYNRMRRDTATTNFLGAYTNSGRTSLSTSVTATIPSTAANSLTHLHHSGGNATGGSQTVTATIDNVYIADGVAP